jgi:hypothetical protein
MGGRPTLKTSHQGPVQIVGIQPGNGGAESLVERFSVEVREKCLFLFGWSDHGFFLLIGRSMLGQYLNAAGVADLHAIIGTLRSNRG